MQKGLLFFSFAFLFLSCSTAQQEKNDTETPGKVSLHGLEAFADTAKAPFYHGVASGDPLQDAVMIWTRVTPPTHQRVIVKWKIGTNSSMSTVLKSGEITADSSTDYTVKVDVKGLQPNHHYWYCFEALGKRSEPGRTKTLPAEETEHVRLAFASCSNYGWGYFNAYELMAHDTLDAVVHLGDYIYEHEQSVYADQSSPRKHLPNKELISLTDYRIRYSQYRLDKDLQYVHAMHPFITVWDDHELANNAYKEGAGNHQENEGSWAKRFAAAEKAYYEWMPVRPKDDHTLYRAFKMGTLANLVMVDTRADGRDKQVEVREKSYADSSRKIMDSKQLAWLKKELEQPVKWRVIGNQVLFGPLQVFFSAKGEVYTDGWDDYPYQKEKLLQDIAKLDHVIFVTGDFHSSFVLDNMWKGKRLAREFVVPSISSANYDEDFGPDSAKVFESRYTKANPNLLYTNLTDHGYMVLDLNGDKATGIFKFVDGVKQHGYKNVKRVVMPY